MSSSLRIMVGLIIGCSICCCSSIAIASTNRSTLYMDAHNLLAFIQDVSSPIHGALQGWDAAAASNPCIWTGVTCDHSNLSVIALDLPGRKLSGFISPKLALLSHLQSLNLSNNSLSGSISASLLNHCPKSLLSLSLANNSFTGSISPGISNCSALTYLDLSHNGLSGFLPTDLGQLSHLQTLNLDNNLLTGPIPPSLSNCTQLKVLGVRNNSLTGVIPEQLSELRMLQSLRLSFNKLSGEIPVSLLLNCTKLTYLGMGYNHLSGPMPVELGQMDQLRELWMLYDGFYGNIPETLGNLSHLTRLAIAGNKLTGTIPKSLGNSLPMLAISISYNSLSGSLPVELANLTNLQILRAEYNQVTGTIPPEYGRMSNLAQLELQGNHLIGEVPMELSNCSLLIQLRLNNNLFITGRVPEQFGRLHQLSWLDLSYNQLIGPIPASFSNLTGLQNLSLGYNHLTGVIPTGPWLSNVLILSLPENMLTGVIPREFGGMIVATTLDVSGNNLTGTIPGVLGNCVELERLNLSHNLLQGRIPSQLATLQSLLELDLSSNALSGPLPEFLAEMKLLTFLNVSYNFLEGPIPANNSGVFRKLNTSSFLGNAGLCGSVLSRPCSTTKASHKKRAAIWAGIAAAGTVIAGSALLCLYVNVYPTRQLKVKIGSRSMAISLNNVIRKCRMLIMTTEDLWEITAGFSSENVIKDSSLSTVYRGTLADGKEVAVKRLKYVETQQLQQRQRCFVAEVEVLSNVRHRNLVRMLGMCADSETKAVILELMPNGSLENQLYDIAEIENGALYRSWEANKRIAIGVAQGLTYLHHETANPILHCDIKPSNILLDTEMEPHVADFGLARVLKSHTEMGDRISTSIMRGSIGYMAPEFAYSGRISTKGDVYSYGIVLLELVTRRRPTSDLFIDAGLTLATWVHMAVHIHKNPHAVIHPSLLRVASTEDLLQIVQVMEVALQCTKEKPKDRPTMREVLYKLVANSHSAHRNADKTTRSCNLEPLIAADAKACIST